MPQSEGVHESTCVLRGPELPAQEMKNPDVGESDPPPENEDEATSSDEDSVYQPEDVDDPKVLVPTADNGL